MHRGSCSRAPAMEERREKVLKLFGVRINGGERAAYAAAAAAVVEAEEQEEEVMRKSSSMGNLASCTATDSAADRAAADAGYVSDGGLMQSSGRRKRGGQERKRGIPWTEKEHRTFLAGLEQLGKGDWRGISRNFVTTRTPTQVASHAQKYFLRQSNPGKKKRRSSLFDVVIGDKAANPETVSVVSPKKTQEITDGEINHLNKDNVLAVAPVEPSQFLTQWTDSVEVSNFPNAILMVKYEQVGSISNDTVKDHQAIFPMLNTIDQMATQFQSNIPFAPDLLGLSLPYSNFQGQQPSSTPSSVDIISDLELRIAPPQPHIITKLSSQGAADAIIVV